MTPHFRLRPLSLLAVLLTATSGCGKAAYEAGLARTADYYAHVNRLNENLSAKAISSGGVSVRLPLQFSPMADDPETEPNELQPYYLGLELPGVVGAYRADVNVSVGGQVEPHPAFLYVCSNGPLLAQRADGDQSVEPLRLIEEIELQLQQAFGVVLPPGADGDGRDPNVRYPERLPRQAVYETSKDYTAVRFQPAEESGVFSVPMEFTLYTAQGGGDLQVAFLFLMPQEPTPDEDLQQRLTMMLETVEFTAPQSGGPRPGGF